MYKINLELLKKMPNARRYNDPYYRKYEAKASQKIKMPPKVLVGDDPEIQKSFKDWKTQVEETESKNRRYPLRWTKEKKHESRIKMLDQELNDKEHSFELNLETDHYMLNNTRVPQHLDHWIEQPGAVKNKRDLKLLKKIEEAKAKAALKERIKKMGPNKSDLEIGTKKVVTRRMLRINNMILEEISKLLDELPDNIIKNRTIYKSTNPNIFVNSSVQFSRVEISRDLLHCKIFWECALGQEKIVEKELNRSKKLLRLMLTRSIQMKYSPELIFIHETVTQKQIHSEELVKIAEKELQAYNHAIENNLPLPFEQTNSNTPSLMDVKLEKKSPDPILAPSYEKFITSKWIDKFNKLPKPNQ